MGKLRKFLAHITRREDGITRIHAFEDDDPFDPCMWKDGNYSCDCNRSMFFERAAGTPEKDLADLGECSYGEYSVRISTPTGFIVYQDNADGQASQNPK